MGEFPKIRGKTVKEKEASIEHALRSIARRSIKRATVYIPPVPIFIGCDIVTANHLIGRVLIPFSGTLRDLFVRVGEMTTPIATIGLILTTSVAKTTTHFTLSKHSEHLSVEWEIDAGTLMEIVLESGGMVDILIATAIYPKLEDHKAKQYLLDEILTQEKEEENAV